MRDEGNRFLLAYNWMAQGLSLPHSTVLAVWALLARDRPEAPSVRFARL
jgi:hypothetical protein